MRTPVATAYERSPAGASAKDRMSPLPIAMLVATIATITAAMASTRNPEKRPFRVASLTNRVIREYPTGSPTGKLVFHVFAALAEFEHNLIRERTLAGLKAARARGRHGGRPRKLQPKELKTIRALLKTTEVSVQEIATRFGVSRSTLYRNKLT
jgi:DNA-binding NtrC family response regulator